LFKGDVAVRGGLPTTMIVTAAENGHRLDRILPTVRDIPG